MNVYSVEHRDSAVQCAIHQSVLGYIYNYFAPEFALLASQQGPDPFSAFCFAAAALTIEAAIVRTNTAQLLYFERFFFTL